MPDRHLWTRHSTKTITFDGTAGNGAVGTVTVFTITGRVIVTHWTVFCTDSLTEAGATASMSYGTAANTTLLTADATGGPTAIDVGEFWVDASPLAVETLSATMQKAISEDTILTIGTQNVTGGTLVFDVLYIPLTDGARLF